MNSQAQLTQGPWSARTATNSDAVDLICGVNGKPIAGTVARAEPGDAEFIVRACNAHGDLVKALSTLCELLDAGHTPGNVDIQEGYAAIEKARARTTDAAAGTEVTQLEMTKCAR